MNNQVLQKSIIIINNSKGNNLKAAIYGGRTECIMKKIVVTVLSLMCCLLMAGCDSASSSSQGGTNTATASALTGKKVLVSYYSLTGTTRDAAEKIRQITGGDLFEIRASDPYPVEHDPCLERDKKEIQENARPAVATKVENMQQYDVVFVGYPIWYYQAPMLINTFLESYDLKGKTVIPFCTSGGFPINKSVEVLRPCAPGATMLDGLRYSSDGDLMDWLKGLGFAK